MPSSSARELWSRYTLTTRLPAGPGNPAGYLSFRARSRWHGRIRRGLGGLRRGPGRPTEGTREDRAKAEIRVRRKWMRTKHECSLVTRTHRELLTPHPSTYIERES